MTNARVISVNVGRGKDADWAGKLGRTAIDKRPVAGQVEVGRLGLGGDEQADKPVHGGPEAAVYAYAREDLDWWVEQLLMSRLLRVEGRGLAWDAAAPGVLGRAAAPS